MAGVLAEMNMGILSFGHWIIVALVVFLLFGPRRLSDIMGDLGQGLGSFRRELMAGSKTDEPLVPHRNPVPEVIQAEPGTDTIDAE